MSDLLLVPFEPVRPELLRDTRSDGEPWQSGAVVTEDERRARLDAQVKAGKLSYATIAGDRKVYLLRSELDALLRPNIKRADDKGMNQAG